MEHEVPGAQILPGLNANYRRGRTSNQLSKAHETVGRDSTGLIRDRGLAQILLPKQGPAKQFAPLNSTCSDACEFGPYGFGIEIERMVWGGGWNQRDPLTGDQTEWYARCLIAGQNQLGIPYISWYLGWAEGNGRLPIGTGFRGVANHGALTHHACDQHSDGVFPHERDAIMRKIGELGGSPGVPGDESGVDDLYLIQSTRGENYCMHPYGKRVAVGVTPGIYLELAQAGVKGKSGVDPLVVVAMVQTHLRGQLDRDPTNDEIKNAIG
jgi:hypothetical protein